MWWEKHILRVRGRVRVKVSREPLDVLSRARVGTSSGVEEKLEKDVRKRRWGWSERQWAGWECWTPGEVLQEAAAPATWAAKCAVAAAAVTGMELGREKLSPGMGNVVVAPEAAWWDGDTRDVSWEVTARRSCRVRARPCTMCTACSSMLHCIPENKYRSQQTCGKVDLEEFRLDMRKGLLP